MRCNVSIEYAVIRHLSTPRFLAFAPSFWQDCEMKSWTANTCIPSGVFAFFSHLRHQNEKTNLHFLSNFFFCLNEMCVWWFYYDLIKNTTPRGSTMTRWCLQLSLIFCWCTTHLQTLVFVLPPGSKLQCFRQDGYKEGVAVDLLSTNRYSRSTLTD